MLSALALVSLLATLAQAPDLSALEAELGRIVKKSRGDIGVAVIHIESGATIAIHGDDRFPMASVYKLPIAVEALAQVFEGRLAFDQLIAIGPGEIRDCCTLSRRHPQGGITLTLRELLELMITESDNTAGDAILKIVGGPAVVARRMQMLGFHEIHVNRYEGLIAFEMMGVTHPPPVAEWTLETQRRLIENVSPGDLRAARARYTSDPRDTATPGDMAALLVRLQRGKLLPEPFNELLLDLLSRVKTGPKRIKGRLPPETTVAHKTGTTAVVINDVGIIRLSGNAGHLALAVFVMNGGSAWAMQNAIAELAAAAYEAFDGKALPAPSRPKSRGRTVRIRKAPSAPPS
jgi:beta-lactamase class A